MIIGTIISITRIPATDTPTEDQPSLLACSGLDSALSLASTTHTHTHTHIRVDGV